MDDRTEKYLEDVYKAICEIDFAVDERRRSFEIFLSDFVFRKFVERNIEIIGEAINRVLKINPNIAITSARKIVDTRNLVIHSYDSLIPEILWAIVINHMPLLKEEVMRLLGDKGDGIQ